MDKQYVYEYVNGLTGYPIPSEDSMKAASVIYERYQKFMHHRYGEPGELTFARFLLSKVKGTGFDSFLWKEGTLVKVKSSGAIGLVVGYTIVGVYDPVIAVCVSTSKGTSHFGASDIEKADIPLEVLKYVKSTLKDQVHTKVDEAFDDEP